jgi:uncharacterized protein YehS (DUF1456 family)
MASGEGDGFIMVEKLGGNNFILYKFKLEMVLSTKDLWEIVKGLEYPQLSTVNVEIQNMYE